jgi:tetratricopeptide (TPR) repeat protein
MVADIGQRFIIASPGSKMIKKWSQSDFATASCNNVLQQRIATMYCVDIMIMTKQSNLSTAYVRVALLWFMPLLMLFCGVNGHANQASSESDAEQSQTAVPEDTAEIDQYQRQEEFLQAIETAEGEGGPFDVTLIEPLQGLADLLSEQGKHAEALHHYARLLHINRINQGLYNENQFEVIEKIINGNLALQDWTALNDAQEYHYFLSQRVHAEDDARLFADLNRHIDWKLTYLGLDSGVDKSSHLLALRELSDQAVEMGESEKKDDKFALADAYYRRAMLHYFFVVAIDRSNETGHELSRRQSTTAAAMLNSNYIASNLETNPQMRMEFAKGRRFLEDIQAVFSTPEDKQSLAMAKLYFGDWQMLTGRRDPAQDAYREAYELLLESGLDKQVVNQLLARPVAIPIISPSFRLQELQATESETGIVQASEAESIPSTVNTDIQKPERDDQLIQLDDYYAWSDALPSVHFPFAARIDKASVEQENHIDVELTITPSGKKLATRDPYGASAIHDREGSGNVENVKLVEAKTSKEKTRWEGLADIGLLMFRPRLVDGEARETRAKMRYIFAPDQ